MSESSDKISAELARRLKRLKPTEKMRVVALLKTFGKNGHRKSRLTREERRQHLATRKRETESAVREIDSILESCSGSRLTRPSAGISWVALEVTPADIRSLTQSDRIEAIVEDQALALP